MVAGFLSISAARCVRKIVHEINRYLTEVATNTLPTSVATRSGFPIAFFRTDLGGGFSSAVSQDEPVSLNVFWPVWGDTDRNRLTPLQRFLLAPAPC